MVMTQTTVLLCLGLEEIILVSETSDKVCLKANVCLSERQMPTFLHLLLTLVSIYVVVYYF